MRWNLKRAKLLFGLIPIIAIIFYLLTANGDIYAERTYVAIDVNTAINDTMRPEAGTTPNDYDARENFAIAAGVIAEQPFYQSSTTGKVVANIMNYTQEVSNYKAVKGNAVFAESISLSMFASVAEQKYFSGGHILYKAGKTSNGKVESWPDGITEMDSNVYAQRYGVIPREICKYSVTKESYQTGKLVSTDGKTYTYEMTLNAELAQKYGRREMMTFAKVKEDPKFSTCKLTYTIDENWQVLKIVSEDLYSINMPVLGNTNCRSMLTEVFSYEGDMPARAQAFIDYVPTGDTGDITEEKGAADYLLEAFGAYISGDKSIDLTATVAYDGITLPLSAKIDIAQMDIGLKIGEQILFRYTNGDVYFALGENKGMLTGEALAAFAEKVGLDVSALTGIFDDPDILSTLFADSKIVETDTHVHILMPFRLLNIGFDVDMGLVKQGETVAADTISATIDLSALTKTETVLGCELQLGGAVQFPTPDPTEYVSYEPLLTAVANTLSARGFALSGNVRIDAKDFAQTIGFEGLLGITDDSAFTLDGNVSALGQTVPVLYDGTTLYASLGNIKIKLNTADMGDIVSTVTDMLGIQTDAIDTAALLHEALAAVLPQDATLLTLLDILAQSTYDGTTLALTTCPAGGGTLRLAVSHDSAKLSGLTLDGLQFRGTSLALQLSLTDIFDTPAAPQVEDPDSYIDAAALLPFVAPVKELLAAKTYRFTFCAALRLSDKNETNLPLSGTVLLTRTDSGVDADLQLLLDGNPVRLVYKSGTVYIQAGALQLKLDTADGLFVLQEELRAALQEYPDALPLPQIDSAQVLARLLQALHITGTSPEELVESIVGGVRALSLQNGTLRLQLQMGMLDLTLSLTQSNGSFTVLDLSQITLTNAQGDTLRGSLRLDVNKISPDATTVVVETPDAYLDATAFAPFIRPLFAALQAKTYDLRLSLTLTQTETLLRETITGNIRIVRGLSGIGVQGTVTVYGQALDFLYQDGTVYLTLGNIRVKAGADDITALTQAIHTLFPQTENNLAETETLQTVLDKLGFLLPTLDFAGITDTLGSLTIHNGCMQITVTPKDGAPYTIALYTADAKITSLTLDGLAFAGLTMQTEIGLTHTTEECAVGLPTGLTKDDYLAAGELAVYIPVVKQLAEAGTYRLTVTGGTLHTAILSGDFSGTVTVSRTQPLSLQASLKFRTHYIDLAYIDQTVYLRANDIRLKLRLADLSDLSAELKEHFPSLDVSVLDEIVALLSGILPASEQEEPTLLGALIGDVDLEGLLGMVARLARNDDGTLGLTLAKGDFTVTLSLGLENDDLLVEIVNLNYAQTVTDTSLSARLTHATETQTLTVNEADSYVNLADLSSYIAPVANTVTQQYYDIAFSGSILSAQQQNTALAGELKVQPTRDFANIYFRITLDSDGAEHNLQLHIIDARTYAEDGTSSGDICGYIDYNNFKVQIGYKNALQIVGMARDILHLQIPMLDNLLNGVYVPQDTSVFETMNIEGLNEIRDSINALFAVADDVQNAAGGGILSLLTESVIDSVLAGVKLYYDAQTDTLGVSLDNGIFDLLNKGKMADIQLTQDSSQLTAVHIANLIANGNTVNFSANLSFEPFDDITAPTGYTDFNGITDLLSGLISTANLREFEISGTLKLSVLSLIKPEIPLNIKVKIRDDGSTVAAVKMQVPFVSMVFAVGITRTDSYIYFANDRLYFVVDVWSSWIWGEGSYDHTEIKSCTVQEFLANPADYLFFLLRMNSTIENPIRGALTGSSSGSSNSQLDLNSILKTFAFDGSNFRIKLGLAELAGSSDLSDMDITLSTARENTEQARRYITKLNMSTSFVGVVDMSLGNGAYLSNICDSSGNLFTDENGKVINKGAGIPSLGRKYGNAASMDGLEDKLAEVFPVEAAETFAVKTTARALRAQNAADAAFAAAQTAAEPDSTLTTEDCRTAAVTALNAARYTVEMLTKTANAAQAATADDSVRAANAAADAATATVKGIYAAQNALAAAMRAAGIAGDTELAREAAALQTELQDSTPANGKTAAVAAITAGGYTKTIVQQTATAADAAATVADAAQAEDAALAALQAIAAMQNTAAAANYAALLAGDSETVQQANENAADVAVRTTAAAQSAQNAARTAANLNVEQARNATDTAAQTAATDSVGALTAAETAMVNITAAKRSLTLLQQAAAYLETNDEVVAVQTAVEAATLFAGEKLGTAASVIAQKQCDFARNVAASVTDYEGAKALIEYTSNIDRAVSVAQTALRYAPNATNTTAVAAAALARYTAVTQALPAATQQLRAQADIVAARVAAACQTADNTNLSTSGWLIKKTDAAPFITPADNLAAATGSVSELAANLKTAAAISADTLTLAAKECDESTRQQIVNTLAALIGDDDMGYKSAIAVLTVLPDRASTSGAGMRDKASGADNNVEPAMNAIANVTGSAATASASTASAGNAVKALIALLTELTAA